jgi:putative heme-binding domain-containing protein
MGDTGMVHRALTGAWAILCACAPWPTSAQQQNPFEADPTAIRAGEALYASRCADCHGPDAKGTRGPDLTVLWTAGANDERVFETIRRGVPGSIMPPSFAPDEELWAVVAYLRSISTVPPFESDGNEAHGRELFATLCACCHRVGDRGGTLGPELTRIAQVRSREALLTAIREPSAAVAEGYRVVTLVTGDGERVRGTVKGEDAFSVQIVDADERLQGYRKSELAEVIRERGSLMPAAWPDRLSDRDLEDLLAFLGTLRGDDVEAAR